MVDRVTGSFSVPRFDAESKLFLKAYFSEGVNFAREKNCTYINMEHKLRDGRGFRSVKIVVFLLKDSKVSSSGMAALRETRSTGTGEYLYAETSGADLGGGYRGCAPLPEMTCGFLIQLVFCTKKICGLLVLK